MTFTLSLNLDNAAFEDAPAAEVARILTALAETLAGEPSMPEDPLPLCDINGNTVGRCQTLDERATPEPEYKRRLRHLQTAIAGLQ